MQRSHANRLTPALLFAAVQLLAPALLLGTHSTKKNREGENGVQTSVKCHGNW
jgi:hypothetical protein